MDSDNGVGIISGLKSSWTKLGEIRWVVKRMKRMRETTVKVVTFIGVKRRKTLFQKIFMTDIVFVQNWGSR